MKFLQLINLCWVVIRHHMCCRTYCSPVLPSVMRPDMSSCVYGGLGGPSLFRTCAQLTVSAAPVLEFSSKCRIYSDVCFVSSLGKREGRLSLQGFQCEGCQSPGSGFSSDVLCGS